MLEIVNVDDMKGYRIEMGRDILPIEISSDLAEINKRLDQYRDIKILNNDDYVNITDKLKIVKGFGKDLAHYRKVLIVPLQDIINILSNRLRPTEQNCNYSETCMKKTILDWNTEVTKKRNEEKSDKLRNAKEEEARIKKILETGVLEAQEKADVLEAQRKIEVDKRKELERKKIEEERRALQVAKQIEEAKEEISKDPSNAEEIGKEIGLLERQKCTAEDAVKKIETDVSNVKKQIRLISKEEIAVKTYAQKLTVEKDALVIAPGRPLTEKVPKVNGTTIAKYLDFKVIDLNIVPREWTNVVITIDEKKLREAIKLKGMNLKIPGIEIYEKPNVRTTSYTRDMK